MTETPKNETFDDVIRVIATIVIVVFQVLLVFLSFGGACIGGFGKTNLTHRKPSTRAHRYPNVPLASVNNRGSRG